jgi:hypothetical protein
MCTAGASSIQGDIYTRLVPLTVNERHAISGRCCAMSFGRRAVRGRSVFVAHPVLERRCRILDARRLVVGTRR